MFSSWDADDQGKALAWHIEQGQKCPRCGSFDWEWGDEHEHIDAYTADGWHCHGCDAIETEQAVRKDMPDTPGTRVILYRSEE